MSSNASPMGSTADAPCNLIRDLPGTPPARAGELPWRVVADLGGSRNFRSWRGFTGVLPIPVWTAMELLYIADRAGPRPTGSVHYSTTLRAEGSVMRGQGRRTPFGARGDLVEGRLVAIRRQLNDKPSQARTEANAEAWRACRRAQAALATPPANLRRQIELECRAAAGVGG